MLSLIEKAKISVDEKEQEKLAKRLQENKFDMNDLYAQFEQIEKMGSISSLIKMIPGVAGKVKEEDIDFLAQSAMDDACRPGNPKDPTKEDIVALYKSLL